MLPVVSIMYLSVNDVLPHRQERGKRGHEKPRRWLGKFDDEVTWPGRERLGHWRGAMANDF